VSLSVPADAQLREIDATKLPQDKPVQEAYSRVQSVESMARFWSPTWAYDTPKEKVASLLSSALRDLQAAEASAPQNEELLLLTGLVAHFAYNVDVDNSYELAVQSLEKAGKLAPTDYRAQWFLAAHRCQSNELQLGMEEMLLVEHQNPWQKLPLDFWHDYINCSTTSDMPAHTLRAVDHAVQLGETPSSYSSAVDIAHNRYKSTDADTTYSAKDAWYATKGETDVQFQSELCGIGFSAHADWHMDIKDVANGTCASVMEAGPYPSKTGQATPELLVLSRPPKPQEQLGDFAELFVKQYPSAHPIPAPTCPSDKCLAFEIVTNTMYQAEGGAHLLVVAFADQAPEYPGLLFEKPLAVPENKSGEMKYYRPDQRLHRLPGVIYTVVLLDSNESIFEKAAADFRFLLESIRLD